MRNYLNQIEFKTTGDFEIYMTYEQEAIGQREEVQEVARKSYQFAHTTDGALRLQLEKSFLMMLDTSIQTGQDFIVPVSTLQVQDYIESISSSVDTIKCELAIQKTYLAKEQHKFYAPFSTSSEMGCVLETTNEMRQLLRETFSGEILYLTVYQENEDGSTVPLQKAVGRIMRKPQFEENMVVALADT